MGAQSLLTSCVPTNPDKSAANISAVYNNNLSGFRLLAAASRSGKSRAKLAPRRRPRPQDAARVDAGPDAQTSALGPNSSSVSVAAARAQYWICSCDTTRLGSARRKCAGGERASKYGRLGKQTARTPRYKSMKHCRRARTRLSRAGPAQIIQMLAGHDNFVRPATLCRALPPLIWGRPSNKWAGEASERRAQVGAGGELGLDTAPEKASAWQCARPGKYGARPACNYRAAHLAAPARESKGGDDWAANGGANFPECERRKCFANGDTSWGYYDATGAHCLEGRLA